VASVELSLYAVSSFDLTIGDLAASTGIAEPTLRMWEQRHGFPSPIRTPSGHRRYSHEQVELIERVVAGRNAGLSLSTAIERAQLTPAPTGLSLFSLLCRRRPELEARSIRKRALIAFSHGIEDEVLARAEAELMFGCFQRELFYRSSQARWDELAACTVATAVFADFDRPAFRGRGPAEIPIDRHQQLGREWGIVAYGGRSSICMVAREPASSSVDAPSSERSFEMVWTADPAAVRDLSEACIAAAGVHAPELAERAATVLDAGAAMVASDQGRLTAAILNRTLADLR
jgi:DICT domain-containing protein